jgi:putative aminopeptidase FrvX
MPRLPERGPARALLSLLALSALVVVPAPGVAQAPALRTVLPQWVGLIAAPGHEQVATKAILRTSPTWRLGPLGTLVSRSGSGSPRRVIACSLDLPAYAVSEIRPDGYLRVHDAEPGRRHPLWDQFHEGQRVLIQTRTGVRAGVFAVRSTHLWRRRPQEQRPVTTDDLWLDVGATSAREVAALGIQLLDPVVRELPQWTYGTDGDPFIAGPGAAQRVGCAVVAALAESGPRTGENVYVIATQSSFGDAGLLAALARIDSVDEVLVLAPQNGRDSSAAVTVARLAPRMMNALTATAHTVHAAAVRARFAGTLMESVRASDADLFAAAMATAADVPIGALRPVALPAPFVAPPTTAVKDALSPVGDLLGRLTDVYAVSGHEQVMRDAVLAELPAWAREKVVVDSAGDLVLALGPERDTSVVIAHMDEIGFEVARIARDGTVSLTTRGGFFPSLWEGQTAHDTGRILPVALGRPDRIAARRTTAVRHAGVRRVRCRLRRPAPWRLRPARQRRPEAAGAAHRLVRPRLRRARRSRRDGRLATHELQVRDAPHGWPLHRPLDRRPRRMHGAHSRRARARSEGAQAQGHLRMVGA